MSPDITSHFKKASKVGWGSQGIGEEIRRAFTEFQVGGQIIRKTALRNM